MIRSLFLVASIALSAGMAQADEPMTEEAVAAAAKEGITFVDNDYLADRQAANADLLLVDVRTQAEYEQGHIPGARWISRGKAEFEFAETVRDAGTEVIVYCRTGSRAALVKKALDAQGYRNVEAHQGFETWAEAGRPFENGLGRLQLLTD